MPWTFFINDLNRETLLEFLRKRNAKDKLKGISYILRAISYILNGKFMIIHLIVELIKRHNISL